MHIDFRLLTTADLPLLHEWLARPHVTEWWAPSPTLAELEAEHGPVIAGREPMRSYFAFTGDAPIGYVQWYVPALTHADGWWLEEHDPGVRGIDQFLANADELGKGLGTRMISAFVRQLFDDPAVTRIQTDPDPRNARAIRCYEKVGFRAEREIETPDGRALLMYCERF